MGPWLIHVAAAVARRMPTGARLALYRLGPLTRLLRRALTRAAARGVHPVQVASGELQGKWLLLDLQVDKDLWLGTYEPHLADVIRRFTPPGGVAFDLGANVGYITLLLAETVGDAGRVYAFEPLPANLDRLRRAVALNHLEGCIEIVAAAVGERSGAGTFQIHASGGMGRLRGGEGRSADFVDSLEVEVIALDDFVFERGNPPPDLVKVDLEGGEGRALRGMSRLLKTERPVLLVELHGGAAQKSVDAILEQAGYATEQLRPDAPGLPGDKPRHIVALPREAVG